ncbi:MAG: glycosyltransferase family 2 protein [Dehalococcoidia bacterium]
MNEPPVVSVIVLGWNGVGYVDECLTTLLDQDIGRPYEVLFIDNGSTDGTPDRAATYDDVQVHRLDRNYGYCIGNNIGFEHACGEYVVFLNQDVVLHRSWLRELLAAIEGDPSIQAAHANILQPWYPQFEAMERQQPVDAAYTADLSPLGYIRYRGIPLADRIVDTTFLHGVSIIARRSFIEDSGYAFDPDMFAYAEDLDLALRVIAAGYRTVAATRATVYHRHTLEARPSLRSFQKTVRIIRNRLLAMWKCSTWDEFIPLATLTVIGAPFNAAQFGTPAPRRVLHFLLLIPPALIAPFTALIMMPRLSSRRRRILTTRRVERHWLLRRLYGIGRRREVAPLARS